jgi:hypothetical protein
VGNSCLVEINGEFVMKRVIICFIFLVLPVMTLTSVNPYPLKVHSISGPDFTLINSTLTDIQPGSGVFQFNATFQNNGSTPATAGTVPISWENRCLQIELSGGVGSLNESVAGLDLNGDGDKIDSFPVTWFHNETRPYDAIVDGVHAYALSEGPPEDPWFFLNRTYYIDGKPKLFQLGTKNHTLYDATPTWAYFGLDAFILHHPSPNFVFMVQFFDLNVAQNVNVTDFIINGESVEINHTIITIEHYSDIGLPPYNLKVYTIPNEAKTIDSGENVTFSCNLRASKTINADVGILINWSPDGNRRISYPFWIGSVPFVVNTTSTTSATSATSPTSDGSPGFSTLTTFPLLLIIVLLIRKRRYS